MSVTRIDPPGFRSEYPTVSVVIVNLNGKDMLGPCLESIEKQTYDPEMVEVILIDNASTDGSVEMVREQFPRVRVLVNDKNVGFSPAVNQAARVANGEILALLNNDAIADPNWISSGVAYLQSHDEVGCVGSLILHSDGKTIDYAGGEMAFNAMGYAAHNNEDFTKTPPAAGPTLFASGGAMLVITKVFLDAGGFDEDFFAFFEDVDFGWRLWIMGLETHFVPASRVYHEHHGTIKRFGYARERFMLERNALATVFKNYGDELFASTFPSALLLTLSRGLTDMVEKDEFPDLRIFPGAENVDDQTFPMSALTAAHLGAIRDFAKQLPTWSHKRQWVQSKRAVSDQRILKLFKQALLPNVAGDEYLQTWQATVAAFGLDRQLVHPRRILIITGDRLGTKMAGPAIRCWEMATVLSDAGCEVTLASISEPEKFSNDFKVTGVNEAGGIDVLLNSTDVVIFQGFVMFHYPQIIDLEIPVLVDLYDPFHIEAMTQRKHELDWQRYATANSDRQIIDDQLRRGDFFVCASEKQRDLWLGHLAMVKRINPATFDADESLRSLIDVAPFGMPTIPPSKHTDRVLRGVVDGINDDDFLLVWGGGIYNWFDPLTLINAVAKVVKTRPNVKLWFMGSAHPNPDVPKMQMSANAFNLADELGLLGTHVFFNEGWIDYDHRADYLLEANVGVSTHFEHLETRYSYRTRILDYIWSALPIIATEGDTLSDLTAMRTLGIAIPPEDVDALADAIIRLHDDQEFYATCKANLEQIRTEMTWEKSLEPIVHFCLDPKRAPDVGHRRGEYLSTGVKHTDVAIQRSRAHYVRRAAQVLVSEGPVSVAGKALGVVRRKFGH